MYSYEKLANWKSRQSATPVNSLFSFLFSLFIF